MKSNDGWRRLALFKWIAGAATAAGAVLPAGLAMATPEPVDEALPIVGTSGHGHAYPGATIPFGGMQLSPDTRTGGWDACSGYNYIDDTILGFSHNHISGAGGADLGNVMVMPFTGELNGTNGYQAMTDERFKSKFSHDNEVAQPGYYKVKLDTYDIVAELTATAHAGMHRYTFPASDQSHFLIDLVHGIQNQPNKAGLKVENDHMITGYRFDSAWSRNRTLYFALEFSKPFAGFGLELNGKPVAAGKSEVDGKNIRAHFDYSTTAGEQILIRAALSPTSVEEAEKNLQTEITDWDFDAVHAAARQTWNDHLSRIRIESHNTTFRQTFYSTLYHAMSAPVLYNNADGTYHGPDGKNHPDEGFKFYSTFSLWDTFRAENPLLTVIEPERINDFVRSLLAFYQQSTNHLLPHWPLASSDTGSMIGYHAVPVIVDAFMKGFRGYDVNLAYQAIRDTAMSPDNRQDEYQKLGYVPWVQPVPRTKNTSAATSRTLEFAYDDWCIAQMAKALGKDDDAALFSKRAEYYKNVWDPSTRFFRSKKADGTYSDAFDPTEVAKDGDAGDGYYTEANAWEYAFFVPQDVPGMIDLYGGKQAFVNRLDEFFNMDSDMTHWRIDVSGMIGEYAHGNEPCHQIAYLYALAGAQYKTAARVRQIMLTQYDNSPDGLCGNDDCGQISAWYVWSALGLYPVNPASGIYVIGSPMVEKATIQLGAPYAGGTFTIITHTDPRTMSYTRDDRLDVYIDSATLNGKPLEHPWITQQELTAGGTLDIKMSVTPNKSWGAQ